MTSPINRTLQTWRASPTLAHVAPLAAFMLLGGLAGWFLIDNEELPWWRHSPEHWVYPLQTVVAGALLWWFRDHYRLAPWRGLPLATALGALGIVVWLLPAWAYTWFGVADWPQPTFGIPMVSADDSPVWSYLGLAVREDGFDPWLFEDQPWVTSFVIAMRFLRMVVVVALIEEIFWRSFLMRYVIADDREFHEIEFGIHSWKAYFVTTLLFALIHAHEDWLGALVYGSLTYYVAIRTRSLAACVWMHAVANLLLGLYVIISGHHGFW